MPHVFDVIRVEPISEELCDDLFESSEIDRIVGELGHMPEGFLSTFEF